MDNDLWHQQFYLSTFIFDLEFIGTSNDLKTCHIWEIGVQHLYSGSTFSATIYPDIRPLPPPFSRILFK